MRVRVAFTPAEALTAPVGIVVDVLRATSTIAQALASGYRRVLCCADVDDARALARDQGDAVLGGERDAVRIPGFHFGNSPSEYDGEPAAGTLVLTTTNGTRLLLAAASRCDVVLVGSLVNFAAVVAAARRAAGADDVGIMCAGVGGEFALDDAYVAGRIAGALGGEASDSSFAAVRLAETFADVGEALGASRSAANLRRAALERDVAWCARESVLDVVPRYVGMVGAAAEVSLAAQ
jgi:2-phosphosulfolactate phosphatase